MVQLLDLESGDVTPVSSPMDGKGQGFDHALGRAGWVAVLVQYELAAYRDGSMLHPTILPPAWRVRPAVSADELLIDVFQGSHDFGQPASFAVVSPDGVTQRSAALPTWYSVGEIDGRVVTGSGIWSWAGVEQPPLGTGHPIGVLSGSAVVLNRNGEVEIVDCTGRSLDACKTPAGSRFDLDVRYDTTASRLAATDQRHDGVLVVDPVGGSRWIPLAFRPWHPVWLGEHELLLLELADPSTAIVFDLSSGSSTALELTYNAPMPRIDVTGRFDPGEVRTLLAPEMPTPPSPAQRDAALVRNRAVLASRAPSDLRDLLELAQPAVRLRACLPSRRLALGGSRLGGCPDLPSGTGWPKKDGRPLAFLAQVRLEEAAPAAPDGALPAAGLVVVFLDLDPAGGLPRTKDGVFAEIKDTANLRRFWWRDGVNEKFRYQPAILVPEPILSLPVRPILLTDDDIPSWSRLLSENRPSEPHHQMFGHSMAVEGHPPMGEDGPYILLLQIDSDRISGMTFDKGLLQLWVPHKDLMIGDLTRCTVTFGLADRHPPSAGTPGIQ